MFTKKLKKNSSDLKMKRRVSSVTKKLVYQITWLYTSDDKSRHRYALEKLKHCKFKADRIMWTSAVLNITNCSYYKPSLVRACKHSRLHIVLYQNPDDGQGVLLCKVVHLNHLTMEKESSSVKLCI